jgi:hypothetical protein
VKGLQIFRPGKHTASDGSVHDFTEARLRGCVEAYDPSVREAPLVIGHPKTDDPAYGWVKSLAFGETLEAIPHQVNPEFAQLVNSGAFKKMSASFYLEDAPGNPKPGTLYLRHIGFLGAKAPAIAGLKSASFAADEKGVIEFADWNGLAVAGLFRKIKNYLIDKDGQERADQILPEWEIENLTVTAAQKNEPAAAFSEPEQGAHVDPKEKAENERKAADLKAGEEKLARERAEFAQSQVAARAAEIHTAAAAFVDGLVKDGRVLPAQRDGLVHFMAGLQVDGIVEFGEGDKAVKKPATEWFRSYLASQPKIVDFTERGKDGVTAGDLSAVEISRRAVEFQESEKKAGREISVTAAVTHVTQLLAK